MQRFSTAVLCATLAASATAQFTLVAPNGYSTTPGNSNNAYPWNRAAASMRIQFLYDSTNFTLQGVSSPIIISRLRYRTYTAATSWTGGSWPNVQIDMSSAAVDYLTPSATFAANHGANLATVLHGPVTVQAGSGAGTWYIDIPLTTPFVYDPTTGTDLCLDVILDGTGWAGTSTYADHVTGATGAGGPALSTRVYDTTGITNPSGTIGANYGAVCEFTYVPATGLWPSFTATPRSGPLNTTVQFTDQTYTSDPSGVLAWQWDFDGDSVVDSSLQNPSFTYTQEGVYNVSLTAIDGTHGPQTLTRNGYIKIDAVTASFTGTVLSGTTVLFTDTSAGSPTTWAWDFDGDSVIDSTAQNAAFTYPVVGAYNVTLTVTDAISTDTTTVPFGIGVIPMPAFGSTYTAASATRGVWFQAPVRFSIVSLQVPDESSHGLQNVAVYRLAGAPPAYSASATGGLEFLQLGTPSLQTIPCAISFDANEYVGLIAACGDATTMRTSYATPAGPFASSILGNPVTLTRLLTQTNLVTTMGTAPYSSEVAGNIGRVNIGVSSCVGLPYGTGTPSGAGPAAPTLKTTSLPFIGQTAVLSVDNHDTNALGLMVIGVGRANIPTPVGNILVNNIGANFLLNGGSPLTPGNYSFSVPVPNNPSLNGVGPFNWQNINLLLSTSQISMSNGQEWWLAL